VDPHGVSRAAAPAHAAPGSAWDGAMCATGSRRVSSELRAAWAVCDTGGGCTLGLRPTQPHRHERRRERDGHRSSRDRDRDRDHERRREHDGRDDSRDRGRDRDADRRHRGRSRSASPQVIYRRDKSPKQGTQSPNSEMGFRLRRERVKRRRAVGRCCTERSSRRRRSRSRSAERSRRCAHHLWDRLTSTYACE